jgi:hypothetical protein
VSKALVIALDNHSVFRTRLCWRVILNGIWASFYIQGRTVHGMAIAPEENANGGWSRKEILGHLNDSALNNHQPFVRATLAGSYDGPSYQQEGGVLLHGYK